MGGGGADCCHRRRWHGVCGAGSSANGREGLSIFAVQQTGQRRRLFTKTRELDVALQSGTEALVGGWRVRGRLRMKAAGVAKTRLPPFLFPHI